MTDLRNTPVALPSQGAPFAIRAERASDDVAREALLDAGIVRLRPVMITVGATVLGLIPLAMHGGPLWEPLCYAQIGGLTIATFVTLLLVPVLYSIFVLDLKLIKWEVPAVTEPAPAEAELVTGSFDYSR